MKTPAAPRLLSLAAGSNQLINWGISFYMPGTFARAIATETGWSSPQIYLGLTVAMLVMAGVSPFVARLLACFGGQRVVMCGTLLISVSCLIMAQSHGLAGWYCAWLLAGVGMRLSLYDALFASLVNLYGQNARRMISRVTLAGGLASAIFWPLGAALLTIMSWREALLTYALFGLLSAALIRVLPHQTLIVKATPKPPVATQPHARLNAWLYAAFIALITFVSNGTSTHLPEFIANAGLPVTIGMLWGIGQTGARLLDVMAGARLTPTQLMLITALAMPLCFLLGISSSVFIESAAGFVLGYGAINGLVTIVKATLPLELFAPEDYAQRTGVLLIPAQLMAAVSPFAYAELNKALGISGSMWVSWGLTLIIGGLAVGIAVKQKHPSAPARAESTIP
ncbi:MFS transporter [Lelliottia amnigena]|uniref:MFS transporter n=1 Tax=Lelliottia amnigena TaxID=61646 RepID=A0AAP2AEI5_LELAM|nr:MFS transporter [Lelliottia amnigena]MBL5899205.1 MFS transporter [Lelliottia amnigena]MBL5934719.1 MFS transporter [Lelliottia amnigena]TCD18188.1 MFS transporter [Lelliottia amnigena]